MSSRTIDVTNVGPVEKLSFTLPGPGVTVLSAQNGRGKSVVLDAVQKLAKGGGRIPLRDGAKKGKIEGFGAVLTISSKATHTGEFEVSTLEGRFDLAELVDPGIDDPAAADRRRVRALVSLTGHKPDLSVFKDDPDTFPQFDTVVSASAGTKHDLVDVAEEIKRNYEAAARKAEDQVAKEKAAAEAIQANLGEIDAAAAETDEEKLRAIYDAAVLDKARLEERQVAAQQAASARREAQQRLEAAKGEYQGPTTKDAANEAVERALLVDNVKKQVEEFKQMLAEAESLLKDSQHEHEKAVQRLENARAHERLVSECEAAIGSPLADGPTGEELAAAEQRILKAKSEMDYGVTVRQWKLKSCVAAKHRDNAREAEALATAFRAAAGSIDSVLSSAIQCEALKIASVEGKARLVVQHPLRGETPFHELSEGERWKIAIDLGAEQVGEGGLLVIPQEAWESLDCHVRPLIHRHAIERKVHILTAEATRDPSETGFVAKPFEAEVANG